jgi:hypothetical protein
VTKKDGVFMFFRAPLNSTWAFGQQHRYSHGFSVELVGATHVVELKTSIHANKCCRKTRSGDKA